MNTESKLRSDPNSPNSNILERKNKKMLQNVHPQIKLASIYTLSIFSH